MSTPDPDDDRTVIRPRSLPPQAAPVDAAPQPEPVQPPAAPAPEAPPAPPGSGKEAAAEHGNALPIGSFLGEFELTSVLGEGGFGIVYLAWDHSLERRVALKEYMPSALAARSGATQVQVRSARHQETFEVGLRSFVNEAKLLAQFDHPSLVKVYRFWEANGTAYMVMPFYEGTTLKDHLKALGQPPDEAWLMELLAPLTEALAVVHAENCYHRDIAPDNVILLQGSERPLLLDFGAARRVIGDMTQALTVILKPGYAPVEQYAETPGMKQGPWTDVYALAATMHFAIVGRTPPPAVGRLIGDSYQPLQDLAAVRYSERFLQAIDRALGVRPEDRTPSIAAFRGDLGLGDVTAAPARAAAPARVPAAAPAGARAPDAPGRSRGLALAAGGAVLLAAGAAALFLRGEPAAPTAAEAPPAPASASPVPSAGPAAGPATAARFNVLEQFDRVVAGQSPDFQVEARPVKPVLRIGQDLLGFTVRSARAGHVHVYVQGPDGELLLLFPNSQAPDNRIQAGETLKLPQTSWALETSEPAGAEHFLVVVTETPRDLSELGQDRAYFFLKLPSGEAADRMLQARSDGLSPLLGRPEPGCQGPACGRYGAARFKVDIAP